MLSNFGPHSFKMALFGVNCAISIVIPPLYALLVGANGPKVDEQLDQMCRQQLGKMCTPLRWEVQVASRVKSAGAPPACLAVRIAAVKKCGEKNGKLHFICPLPPFGRSFSLPLLLSGRGWRGRWPWKSLGSPQVPLGFP